MPSDSPSDLKFEIGHVLFIDVVGYSKLLINEQSEQLRKLKDIVRGSEQAHSAAAEGKLLRLPTGDGGAWRKELESVANKGPEAGRGVAFLSLLCAWAERDRAAAEKAIALVPPEGIANTIDERRYCANGVSAGRHESSMTPVAQTLLTAARTVFERMTRDQPDYAQAWAYLGLTDTMLGRRDDAIREGSRACELLPYSRDSWVGSQWINDLAMIYAWVGDKESALKELEISVNIPTGLSYGEFKTLPRLGSIAR